MQGISRVIMSSTELKMQPTLHYRKIWLLKLKMSGFFAFFILTGSLSLVKYSLFNKMEDKSKKTKRSRGNNFWKDEELLLLSEIEDFYFFCKVQSIAPITRGTLAIWYIFSALLCISSIFSYMLT
jgi:hypothetical protein